MSKGVSKTSPYWTQEEDEHEEELWLVSYADMVTLLFGFFVILFSFSTLDEKKFDQMTEKVAEAFNAKDEKRAPVADAGISSEARQLRALQMLVAMLSLGESVDDAVTKIEKSYAESKTMEGAKAVVAEKVQAESKGLVESVGRGKDEDLQTLEMVLPDASLFPPGSYHLTPEATVKLKALAADLRQVADLTEIEVAGHTDGRRVGPPYDSNFTLSALRAGAVASVLIRFGVDDKKLTVRGMGSLRPLVPEHDRDGRPLPANMAKNRRVTIALKVRHTHDPVAH